MDFTKVKEKLVELHKNKTAVMNDFHESWNVKEFLKRRGFKTTFRHCSDGTYEINITGQRFATETLDSLWNKVLMEDFQAVMAEEAAKTAAAAAQEGTQCPNPTNQTNSTSPSPESPQPAKTESPDIKKV